MKFNKKVLIPVCATAMGLSAIGGIAGAVAWYQYNSKVSASFVGASVADTGVLQIGHKENANSDISWGRDFYAGDDAAKLVPVTFGALEAGNVRKYVTDFANAKVVNFKNTIVLPHLGASTEEAEDNCALMAIQELKDYLENGNIKNSVNYPAVDAGVKNGLVRITIAHKNVPGVINHFTKVVADNGANISTLVSQSKGEYAYTILDADKAVDPNQFKGVEGVIRVRVVK